MSKPQSVVVTARKYNNQIYVAKPNHKKEKAMKHQTTESHINVVKAEVAVNTRITEQFSLSFKKLAVTTSLGFVAGFAIQAASLP
jgi:hypothetical protein